MLWRRIIKIISHRGYWKEPFEKNTELAFRRSFDLGFGTETDIRDLDGELVICHDMPISSTKTLLLDHFFDIYSEYKSLPLALNIKSDGLQKLTLSLISKYNLDNYVLFDMSLPDQIVTAKHNLKHLTRISEYESAALLDAAEGVWADEFNESWIDLHFINGVSKKNKSIYIVSPELHGRSHLPRWDEFKNIGLMNFSNVYLCTDLPEQAKEFFEV